MTCQMCPRTHSMSRPHGNMSRELYLKVVNDAAASTSKFFLHHFGDSLLHPELGSFIGEATSRGMRSYLSGNPVLLTASRIRDIVDNGLHELVLSLDGITPETSEAVRGRAARNVSMAERRIRELVAYKQSVGAATPHIIMQIVRQRQNAHEIDAWLRRWRTEPGIHRVKVKSYVTWSGGEERINELRIDQSARRDLVCEKPWTSVTILWDGTVVPCCFDHDGLLAVGDLRRQSLLDVWRGEPLAALRRQHREGDLTQLALCRNCVDKEGYPVRKLSYPFNRLRQSAMPLSDEFTER
jgi:MoaA/NifB/PqqE/SkfB family radical SAM enzyme